MRFTTRGIGITKEQRELVFESFAQADSSITRNYGGTGPGLAIAANLVELMGGRLSVESFAMTAATQPSIEDIVFGAIPGIPKVNFHNPVLAFWKWG